MAKKHGIVETKPEPAKLTPEQSLLRVFQTLKLTYFTKRNPTFVEFSTSIDKEKKAITVSFATMKLYKTPALKAFEEHAQEIAEANAKLSKLKNTYYKTYNVELTVCTKETSTVQDQDAPLTGAVTLKQK